MIDFRCWYCNRRVWKPAADAGRNLRCPCGHDFRVPKRSGGSSRFRTLTDWLVEVLVYGGGGAFLGCFLGIMVGTRLPFYRRPLELVLGLTVFGFLLGAVGGERGVNWVGRRIREREQSR